MSLEQMYEQATNTELQINLKKIIRNFQNVNRCFEEILEIDGDLISFYKSFVVKAKHNWGCENCDSSKKDDITILEECIAESEERLGAEYAKLCHLNEVSRDILNELSEGE